MEGPSLADFKRSQDEEQRDQALERERREAAFAGRVARQQFMNQHAPIFAALARKGFARDDEEAGRILLRLSNDALRVSRFVASRLQDGGEPDPADVRWIRPEVAAMLAAAWEAGEPVELRRTAETIIEAVRAADPKWDVDPYAGRRTPRGVSLAMTAAGLAARLTEQVAAYDFRQGHAAVLGRLVAAVTEAARSQARVLAPEGSTAEDVAGLAQSLVRHLGAVMAGCYERRAREVVRELLGRDEAERRAFYRDNAPLDDVLEDFHGWTAVFSACAAAATEPAEQSAPAAPADPAR